MDLDKADILGNHTNGRVLSKRHVDIWIFCLIERFLQTKQYFLQQVIVKESTCNLDTAKMHENAAFMVRQLVENAALERPETCPRRME